MERLLGHQERPMPSSSLLSTDSDAHQLPEEGLHGLHRAAARGDLARLRQHWWLKKLRKNRLDQAKRTPLHLACANGHADVVRFLVQEKCLLNLCDNTGRSPLMKAVESQHEECVAILLEHHANPNLEGYRGNSALHLAAAAPNTSLAELLIEHGAHLEAKNWEGNTPLLLAISSNHKEMVDFLLQKGATVCDKNDFGRTALMLAASVGEMDVVELLLSYGATITCKDIAGYTAVDYALQSGHIGIARKLVEHAHCQQMGEASADAAQDTAVPSRFCPLTTERFLFHTRALDEEGDLPAVEAEQEEEAELPTDHKDLDRQLKLELPVALQRLLRLEEATRQYTASQRSDMEKGIQCLRAQLNVFKAEDRDRQLQMELPGAPESLSASETPPEATESQLRDDEKDAERLREELETAKAECQCGRRKEKQQIELKRPVKVRLEQEMKRNSELQRECERLRRHLNAALQKLSKYEARERETQFNTAEDMTSSCSEGAHEVDELTAKLKELSQQLEMESEKRKQLLAQNCDLQEELSALRDSQEKLEKTNGQLQEEVAYIKDLLKTSKLKELPQQLEMESEKHRQLEAQNCKLQEELSALRSSLEKMEKTNGQLQEEVAYIKDLLKASKTRAASPDMQELSRSPPCTSPNKKPTHRSRDAESEEEDGGRKTPQEHTFPNETVEAKLERYKHYYREERQLRRLLENDQQRARQSLDKNNAKLHRKHH